jgi:transposase-like protein
MSVEQVELRLSALRCAVCKQSRFMIDRLSMQPDGEWRGVCKDCRYTFPVYTDMVFYQRTQPDLTYWLKQIACPACRHRGARLDFRVAMSVRESCYFVTCPACQSQFTERSALESFE